MDPYFHILGEVERKHAERMVYDEWRKGTEVKVQVGDEKVPVYQDGRF
jgi:hypothetical protein